MTEAQLEDSDWRVLAACRDEPEELFFPQEEGVLDEDGIIEPLYPLPEAKRICNERCPVRAECLDFALKVKIEVPGRVQPDWVRGTWAGTSTYTRELMRRRQERKSCPTCHSRDVIKERFDEVCQSCGASWPAPPSS